MAGRLAGRVAVITGGGGGIGAATGRLFAEEGATVALVDRDEAALEAAGADIRAAVAGAAVTTIAADLGTEEACAGVVAEAAARQGPCDVLVNNAGIRSYEPLAEASAETWQKVLSVNLLSYAWMAKAAAPALRASGHGSIVNLSSTYGVTGRPGMGQYDATKAAILALTRTLAFEEGSHGVRVNAVCPGYTLTPFHVRRAIEQGRTEKELREEEVTSCILHRWAHPREIAFPILFLASAEASYVTGATFMVDGGRPMP